MHTFCNYVLVRSPEKGSNWHRRPAGDREPKNGVIARGRSPRVITPSEGEGLPKGHLWQLDSESEWSNWLRPHLRRATILLRTFSSFASLEERSDVVSLLPNYWQPRCTSLRLERLRSSSAKVELAFDNKWIIHEGSNWHKHPASNLELQSFQRNE